MNDRSTYIDSRQILICRLSRRLLWQSDQEFTLAIQYRLNNGISNSRLINCGADFFNCRSLSESYGNHGAAFEVDTEVKCICAVGVKLVPVQSGAHARQHQRYRNANEETALAKPVDVD